jgi:hypothetical protein
MKQQGVVSKKNMRRGQALLIAVLSLGGAILGATTVAGLLTLYQIRATTDTANSAKAIFAADAGVEWAQFSHYCSNDNPPPTAGGRCPLVTPGTNDYALPTFSNNAMMTVTCYSNTATTGATTTCSNASTTSAISTGVANGSERAFFIGITTSTPAYP